MTYQERPERLARKKIVLTVAVIILGLIVKYSIMPDKLERIITIDPDIGILGIVHYGQTKQSLDAVFDKEGEDETIYSSGRGSGGKEYSSINCIVNFSGENSPKVYSVSTKISDFQCVMLRCKGKEIKVCPQTKMDEFKQFFKNNKVLKEKSGMSIHELGVYVRYEYGRVNQIYVSELK